MKSILSNLRITIFLSIVFLFSSLTSIQALPPVSEKDLYEGLMVANFFYGPLEKVSKLPRHAQGSSYHLDRSMSWGHLSRKDLVAIYSILSLVKKLGLTSKQEFLLNEKIENLNSYQLSLLLGLLNGRLQKDDPFFEGLERRLYRTDKYPKELWN